MKQLVHLVAIVGLVLVGSGVASGAPGDEGPPFRAGEVVVAGLPTDFPGFEVVKVLPHAGLTVLKVETGREWGQVQSFRADGRRAGLNFIAQASYVPNDPFYSPYQWHLSHIQSEAAWEITTGSGAVVAVLDTGLKTGGPDGVGCVVPGYDVVNGDTDPQDGDGHGTHVSGTIAQTTNNVTGCAGMAFGACVMPVKVLDDSGSGSFADIAEGIYYAVNNGAHVINMSLGVNAKYRMTNDPLVDPALDYADILGVTVVCAAGNDRWSRNVGYPAIYPTTIAVGATNYNNVITSYSNSGTGLDLMAPGGDSADNNGDGYPDGVLQETYVSGEWGYSFFTGTSMASPHVAAVVALLYANGSADTPEAVRQALAATALDLGVAGYDSTYGWGLVQAADALGGAPTCIDADADDYCANQSPVDCDDGNPAVNPGATEVCGDGIDNDCDGEVDEGCVTCTDNDGDLVCVEAGDCDDTDPTIYPGAPEVCGDGIDQDCSGADLLCDCAGFKEPCQTDADCCSNNCFTKKGYCK